MREREGKWTKINYSSSADHKAITRFGDPIRKERVMCCRRSARLLSEHVS
jgi:hypothetical protein